MQVKLTQDSRFSCPDVAHESVLILNSVVLHAEFYSLSDGIIFKGGSRAETRPFCQIINFAPCRNFGKKKNLVQIRPWICAEPKSGCAQCRIRFSMRWHHFQGGRWVIENPDKIFYFFEIFAFGELVVSRIGLVFTRWYQLKMMSSDTELNSASSTTGFSASTDSWANSDKNYSGKLLILVVFWPESLVFARWPLLKMTPSGRELNSASSTTGFRISTNSWANPDKENANLVLTLLAFHLLQLFSFFAWWQATFVASLVAHYAVVYMLFS